jgi:ATP adenylyltransferase
VIERLWAGWRSSYVNGEDDGPVPAGSTSSAAAAHGGAAQASGDSDDGKSLFERILTCGLPDEQTYVLWRGHRCAAMLNAFPYTSGHVMVLPQRAVADLDRLERDELTELWAGVEQAVLAVRMAYQPGGINVGANLGLAAGAGVPDHLHIHVLPRWEGDTNFMTTVAETRVLPEPLDVSWRRLRAAWPSA